MLLRSPAVKSVYLMQMVRGVKREVKETEVSHDAGDKGEYRHYMLKEIHEQPVAPNAP